MLEFIEIKPTLRTVRTNLMHLQAALNIRHLQEEREGEKCEYQSNSQ